jgi:peroxiredoxin
MWKGMFLIGLIISATVTASLATTVGEKAPDFRLPRLTGEEVALASFQGKVTLVNFWASWCVPCRDELPALQKIYDKYRDRPFEIVGINLDKQRKNAHTSVERYGLNFTVLHDPNSTVIRRYQGKAMPCSYLIDQNGVIREVFNGFSTKKQARMETAIEQLLTPPAR